MATIRERLNRRRCYPVEMGTEKFYVRALTIGELKAFDELAETLRPGFMLACALVDDSGAQEVPRINTPDGKPESNAEYAARATAELSDTAGDTLTYLIENIWKVIRTPDVEELRKNS